MNYLLPAASALSLGSATAVTLFGTDFDFAAGTMFGAFAMVLIVAVANRVLP